MTRDQALTAWLSSIADTIGTHIDSEAVLAGLNLTAADIAELRSFAHNIAGAAAAETVTRLLEAGVVKLADVFQLALNEMSPPPGGGGF